MMKTLIIIQIVVLCFNLGRSDDVTTSPTAAPDESEDEDYDYIGDYEDKGVSERYEVVSITAKTSTISNEHAKSLDNTTAHLIKPVVTTPTPKPGVPELSYVVETSSAPTTNFEEPQVTENFEIVTELPQVTSEDEDDVDITEIQRRIKEIGQNFLDTTEVTLHDIIYLSEIAGAIADLGEEIDEISEGEITNKNIYDLQKDYLHLYNEMEKFNNTLNTMLEAEDQKRVEIIVSLMESNITEAAWEVSKMYFYQKLRDVTRDFYRGKRENIVVLLEFSHILRYPVQQLIIYHSLYSELKTHNQTDDPGILPIYIGLSLINILPEFTLIKHDAGVIFYDAFKESVKEDVKKILATWQNLISNGDYGDIVKFAAKSPVYSMSLNHNMAVLLWQDVSFETNYKFLKALTDLNNRLNGFMYLNNLYKTYHRYEEMIKVAVAVKRELEENSIKDQQKFIKKFLTPVKKLVWSNSCLIKNVFSQKYLFEFQRESYTITYNIETVKWDDDFRDGTNLDLRWKFIPSEKLGYFEIQNEEYRHSLKIDDEVVANFTYWPRRLVIPSKNNETVLWKVAFSGTDDFFSFKSDLRYLTVDGDSLFVYADDKPMSAEVPINRKKEFLEHHLWTLQCN